MANSHSQVLYKSSPLISKTTTFFLSENFTKIELYDSEKDMSEFEIKSVNLNFLNRLKRTNKAAFYYWYNCIEELDKKTFKI